MTNKDYIVAKVEKASNLSEMLSDDVDTAKRALSGLLTDKDRDDIYVDIDVLMTALGDIENAANLIGNATQDAKREFGKEDHNTTK